MTPKTSRLDTDHNGSKNGGGHWGKRSEAKAGSKKLRRKISKRLVLDAHKTAIDSRRTLVRSLFG